MFTGLIESVGEVADLRPIDSGYRIGIRSVIAAEIGEGESVAVNGVCLTALNPRGDRWEAEIGPETARVTSLGGLKAGSLVNLERAMRADGRFGGHLVLGHVDGTGLVQSIRPDAGFTWVAVAFPEPLAPYLIHRGSIAVDGISLTVFDLTADTFRVAVIPHTADVTTLGVSVPGSVVNIELDIVAKHVERLLEPYRP
jgi:riboflavin synthase